MHGERRKRIWIAGLAAALALFAFPAAGSAATLVVDDPDDELVDNADCTLREAIDSANGTVDTYDDECGAGEEMQADTINFDAAFTGTTLAIDGDAEENNQTGDLDSTDDLTIADNNGGARVEIRGDPMDADPDRVLQAIGSDLSLDHVTIRDGLQRVNPGGGLLFNGGATGALDINDTLITDNVANAPGAGQSGGGLHSDGGGPITITNSIISNNRAGGGGMNNEDGNGGGVSLTLNANTATITNTDITGNRAGGGAGLNSDGQGGGLSAGGVLGATLTLTDTDITMNEAGGGSGGSFGNGGGAMLIAPSAFDADFTGGSISDNKAGGNGGTGLGNGAGLFLDDGLSSPTLNSVDVQNNTAGGGIDNAQGIGGGILTQSSLTVDSGSVVSGNDAGASSMGSGDGGGIEVDDSAGAPSLSVLNSTVSDNHAGGSVAPATGIGGGVNMEGEGNLLITASTLQGNTATATGGAVNRTEPDMGSDPSDSIELTTVANNSVGRAGTQSAGGGLVFITSGDLGINRSTISDNFTQGGVGVLPNFGGGILFASAQGSGSGGGSMDPGEIFMTNSTIDGNRAAGGAGFGGIGGGLATFTGPTSALFRAEGEILHSTISDNEADPDGSGGAGGNLHLEGATAGLFDIDSSIVTGGIGASGDENCDAAVGVINSTGGNVEGPAGTGGLPTNQCEFDQPGGVDIHADPLLAPLAGNGGPTQTRGLFVGSPAIDLIPNPDCMSGIDQRAVTRPVSGGCDSGAFEGSVPLPSTPPPPGGGSTTPAASAPTAVVPTAAQRKKCKKGRKLKRGKCVKKKKRKK